ncbi:molybdopterin molybdotransferase [Brachybacterium muris]|uniref:molybdopterin molybdotransferase MoeA n=1 Tax=Brachybacterium muris TaxID=219301 RepID=UPI001EF8A13B|nr:molybdopterin molybdotransferase MoeA [Brachybacterium muris]MBM7499675.1 molybdopterin molybdotransferase [Brachybacterium muris]
MSGSSIDVFTWRATVREQVVLDPGCLDLPLGEALGRVLARPVTSPEDIPAVPLSAMDGFAVRRSDLTAPGATRLPVVADIPARPGTSPELPLGVAMRIMTGAPAPGGADAVVEVEATDADPFGAVPAEVTITLDALPPENRHIRGRGEEATRDDLLAEAGDQVGAGLIGVARALGITSLPVLARPRVGVVVTGDELATSGQGADDARTAAADPAPGMVRESNGLMLTSALEADGAAARAWHTGDDPATLCSLLTEIESECDLVLTTGGIGQGAFDVVRAALGDGGTGTSQLVHLALRPGGPQGMGRLPGGTPVIHLPGTPVGALVGYYLFVRQLLPAGHAEPRRVLLGEDPGPFSSHRHRRAVLAQPGRLRTTSDGTEVVDVLPGRRLTPYARADALVLREPGVKDQADAGGAPCADAAAVGTVLVLPL